MIEVLNGSTSTSRSVHTGLTKAVATIAASTPYFSFFSCASVRVCSLSCGTRAQRASLAMNSCSAPNGHSQPQNVPRPQATRLIATKPHSSTVIGSYRKKSRLRPAISAWISAVMLTMES